MPKILKNTRSRCTCSCESETETDTNTIRVGGTAYRGVLLVENLRLSYLRDAQSTEMTFSTDFDRLFQSTDQKIIYGPTDFGLLGWYSMEKNEFLAFRREFGTTPPSPTLDSR